MPSSLIKSRYWCSPVLIRFFRTVAILNTVVIVPNFLRAAGKNVKIWVNKGHAVRISQNSEAQLRRSQEVPAMKMENRGGFTLIELLVVISIIALLMSILTPALSKVKLQAKAAICLSNLHQWALVMKMYAMENRGLFPDELGLSRKWYEPYYENKLLFSGKRSVSQEEDQPLIISYKLLLCPMATKPYDEGAPTPFGAHFYYGAYASYGHNSWICSKPCAQYQTPDRMWETPNVKEAARVPLVMDCLGYQNASPWEKDEPPRKPGEFVQNSSLNEMKYVCIARHMGYTQMSFIDFSARKVALKRLWGLKWNRKFDTLNPQALPGAQWPDWMEPLPER